MSDEQNQEQVGQEQEQGQQTAPQVQQPLESEEERQARVYQTGYDEASGDWKSLGHSLEYFGELPKYKEGAPNPYHYKPDEQERYREDLSRYNFRQDMKSAVKEALTPPPSIESLLPDDENREERREADEWAEYCQEHAQRARRNGDLGEVKKWEDRSRFLHDDLRKKGPSMREQILKEIGSIETMKALELLGEKALDDDPVWESNPKAGHDSAVLVHKFNRDNPMHILILPDEESPWGAILPVRPANMRFVELDEAIYKDVVNHAYNSGGTDQTEIFKRIHARLRRKGFHDELQPTYAEREPAKKKEEEPTDPENMNQRQFSAWREKNKARRR